MHNEAMGIWIGVCTLACDHCWAVELRDGRLWRWNRTPQGVLDRCAHTRASPPEGFPDGDNTQVTSTSQWAQAGQWQLHKFDIGHWPTIEVLVDHDAGTLAYSVDGEPPRHALSGFPPGAALRPWVRCFRRCDTLSLARPYM